MLLKEWVANALNYAEADVFNTSRAHNGSGLRLPLPQWARRPSAAGSIWGIRFPHILKALAIHFLKHSSHPFV